MGEIRLLRELEEDLEEKQLQRAIEADLTALEDNLQYVASEVVIGTGRIDTLAVDEDGRPTFIEYKRAGKFDKNALVQLMDYLAWFTKNPNHFLFLADYVKRKSPKVAPLEREVRLIPVVSDADERVRNACYVIKNPVTIFTYTTARLENGDTVVLPREILDNADVEVAPPSPPPPEDELVKDQFRDVYQSLKAYLLSLPKVKVYTLRHEIRAASDRVFCRMRFRKSWIKLSLRVGKGKVKAPSFTYAKKGESNWGSLKIEQGTAVTDEIKTLIKLAHEYSVAESSDEDTHDTEE